MYVCMYVCVWITTMTQGINSEGYSSRSRCGRSDLGSRSKTVF